MRMRRSEVVLVAVISSLTTLFSIALLILFFMPGLRAHMSLEPQDIQVSLPEGVPVRVAITEPIETRLKTVLDVQFPIDEVLPLSFEAPLQMDIEINAQVPMQTVIKYENTLPLDSEVTAYMFGVPVNVPIKGNIPVKLYVPVDQLVPVKFKAPVTVSMDKALDVPIKLDFKARIPLDQEMQIPVTKPLETNIQMSDRPVTVRMRESDMVMPLESLRLERVPTAGSD